MSDHQLKTSVAFIIFNRPNTTEKVFDEIRRAKPRKLLVVADGPRVDCPGDAEKCQETRAIIERVDWPCEVLTNYSEINLGCKRRVSSGLDWVFNTVDEAIILEDDCLPHPTFFRFCEELLEKYRDDERVMMISGDNFQLGRSTTSYSYYFSRFAHIWGWASWRRAWKYYDVDMKFWPEIRNGSWLRPMLDNAGVQKHWRSIFDQVYSGKIDTWDYQWAYSCWLQNGLSILPSVNLVSNIGFGGGATHVTITNSRFANMQTVPIMFPLRHPRFLMRDTVSDAYTHKLTMSDLTAIKVIVHKLKNLF